jgi:hypothetical protein
VTFTAAGNQYEGQVKDNAMAGTVKASGSAEQKWEATRK